MVYPPRLLLPTPSNSTLIKMLGQTIVKKLKNSTRNSILSTQTSVPLTKIHATAKITMSHSKTSLTLSCVSRVESHRTTMKLVLNTFLMHLMSSSLVFSISSMPCSFTPSSHANLLADQSCHLLKILMGTEVTSTTTEASPFRPSPLKFLNTYLRQCSLLFLQPTHYNLASKRKVLPCTPFIASKRPSIIMLKMAVGYFAPF